MKAKTYLNQLRYIKSDIRRVRIQIKEIQASLLSVRAMRYDGDRVQSTPDNPTENALIRYADTMEKLNDLINGYTKKYVLITSQIDRIENPLYREVLKQYFVEERKMFQIADRLQYSEKYIYNCYEAGLKAFEDQFLNASK